jgi:hypothetical protein
MGHDVEGVRLKDKGLGLDSMARVPQVDSGKGVWLLPVSIRHHNGVDAMIVNIGKGIELDINAEALPANALEHVIRIGLRNILMDSHAGINSKAMPDLTADDVVAQSRGVAEKKLAALLAGEVRVARSGVREATDPVGAMMARIAKEKVLAAVRAKGIKPAAVKDRIAELVGQYTQKHGDALRAEAQRRVAEAESAADQVDLSGLDL